MCEDKERVAWKQWGLCIQILTPEKPAHGLAWGCGELVSADSQVHGTDQTHNPQGEAMAASWQGPGWQELEAPRNKEGLKHSSAESLKIQPQKPWRLQTSSGAIASPLWTGCPHPREQVPTFHAPSFRHSHQPEGTRPARDQVIAFLANLTTE